MRPILFVDAETTGLPRNWRAPATDVDNWPRLVQIAFHQHDSSGRVLTEESYLICPDGFVIPPEATRIHRITTGRAFMEGHDLRNVLVRFAALLEESSLLVAHNMSFDEKVIGAEFIRAGIASRLARIPRVCTMQASTPYCRLKGRHGYKWPTLAELYRKLFREELSEAHDAAVDIRATARCFWSLVRLKVLHIDGVALDPALDPESRFSPAPAGISGDGGPLFTALSSPVPSSTT